MPNVDTETFLVVLADQNQRCVRTFLFQGTYEQAYKLDHKTWQVDLYLLMPEPQPHASWQKFGAELVHVETLRATHWAEECFSNVLWHLSRCTPQQKMLEFEQIRSRLEQEMRGVAEQLLPATPTGNLERLKRLNIEPLTEAQMTELRR